MTIELKEEILNLIESPELHAYLIKHTERLRLRDYVSIIAGAPISLKNKQRLLHSLEATDDLKQHMDYIKLCCECLDLSVRYLTMESEMFFLIQLMGYDENNKSEIVDGPYIATSLASAKRAVCNYYFEDEPGVEWQTLYWRMELYVVKQSENKETGFLSPEYTYIMNKDGEIQYFIHKKKSLNYLNGPLGSLVEDQFSLYPDLNLPVPYRPGDVLFIDCRPYAPGAFYCLLKEVGDDCCGIQCEYVDKKGNLETGALKHGDYFFNHREVYQYLSPLYRAKIVSKDRLNWENYIRRKVKMFEIVPSQWMKKCFEEIDFAFTDFQKATLVWNAPGKLRQEILDALRELAEETQDENIRKQISERLNYEEKAFEIFIHNQSEKYVYVVEDTECKNCGFFIDYDIALKYAKKYMQTYDIKCRINKQLVVVADADEIVRNPFRENPNLGFETEGYCAYGGNAIAFVTLNMNGEIERFISHELSEAENNVDSYSVERFEYHFIKMPCPLQSGTPVKDIRDGSYFILGGGEETWKRYLERIEEKNLYVDFSDIQMICYELTESGIWSHAHINPLYLEVEFPTYIEDDPKRQVWRCAMEALGNYLSHKSNGKEFCPDLVLKYARKYAEICREENTSGKTLEEAKKPEDIMV